FPCTERDSVRGTRRWINGGPGQITEAAQRNDLVQEIKIFAGLSFVHAALLAIHPGAHRHAGTDRMMRVRKAGVSQRLYVIAQVQFVGSDRFVNRWRQCATQWMREVNTAAGTPRILRKVP